MYSISSTELMFIVLVTGTVLCAVIILIIIALRYYYKKRLASMTLYFIPSAPESISWEYEPDEWEVPRHEIDIIKPIARGSFGRIYRGSWTHNNKTVLCALKAAETHNDVFNRQLLSEANVMKEFSTTHVVRLYGVVSRNDPVFILTEYMEHGDLKSFLRMHCVDDDDDGFGFAAPTLTDILRMAIEIADGMAYLTFKKFVHRDLSAANCLVGTNNVVKVGGFGLAKDVYQTECYKENSTVMVPIRWMAPESLHTGLFTCFSDVWSFGVVLWEIATLGCHPYTEENDKDVVSYVTSGGIMEKPDGCPDILYDYMKLCWSFKASDRPTFNELVRKLLPSARADFEQVSFYHNGLLSANGEVHGAPKNGIPNKIKSIKECNEIEHGNVPKVLLTNQENVDHVLRGSSLPLEKIIP